MTAGECSRMTTAKISTLIHDKARKHQKMGRTRIKVFPSYGCSSDCWATDLRIEPMTGAELRRPRPKPAPSPTSNATMPTTMGTQTGVPPEPVDVVLDGGGVVWFVDVVVAAVVVATALAATVQTEAPL